MKSVFTALILFFVTVSLYGQSRSANSLDDAIYNASLQIQDNLERRSTVIVYQFQSANERISDYVLKELFDLLVNSNMFIVLDRTAQEVINAELEFQYVTNAGMISDASLASINKQIGGNAIITGSLDDAGDEYRFRIRVIGTETTAAIVSYVGRVSKNDRRIAAFYSTPKTTGQKIGTGALNILFGLGSYLEGDITGGITMSAGYAAAAGLFIVEAAALDWNSPAVGVPATIGVLAAGITFVYGFVRPFIYNRSPGLALFMDNTRLEMVYVSNPASGGNTCFRLTHTINF